MNEDWNSVEFQELFWYGAVDAGAFASGDDQCVLDWIQFVNDFRIKVSKRLQTFISV